MRRTVRVAFRPDRTTLRAVAERLASLGYEPVIDSERSAGRMPAARRDLYLQLGIAGFAFGNIMLFSIPRYANGAPLEPAFQRLFDVLNVLFAVPVLLFSASDFFRGAWHALRTRAITLDVPVALGLAVLFLRSLVDIAVGRGEGFLDSFAGLVFFLLIGRLFQQKAFDRIAFDRTVPVVPSALGASGHGRHDDDAPDRGPRAWRRHRRAATGGRPGRCAGCSTARARRLWPSSPASSTLCRCRRATPVRAGGRVVGEALRLRGAAARVAQPARELWNNPVFEHRPAHWITTCRRASGTGSRSAPWRWRRSASTRGGPMSGWRRRSRRPCSSSRARAPSRWRRRSRWAPRWAGSVRLALSEAGRPWRSTSVASTRWRSTRPAR